MNEKEKTLTAGQTNQGQSDATLDLDYTAPIGGIARERIDYLITLAATINARCDAVVRVSFGESGGECTVSVLGKDWLSFVSWGTLKCGKNHIISGDKDLTLAESHMKNVLEKARKERWSA